MVLNVHSLTIDKLDSVNHALSVERYAFLMMPVIQISASPGSLRALGGLIMDLVHLDVGMVKWEGFFADYLAFEDCYPHG